VTPLDLRLAPPRSPRIQMDGLFFLARTVDKVRASFPGGNLGAYRLAGLSELVVVEIGLTMAGFAEAVRDAGSDDELCRWLAKRVERAKYPKLNGLLLTRTIRDIVNWDRFGMDYPFARAWPRSATLFDVLDHDDDLFRLSCEQARTRVK
jgi:Domain of unknown function (DUF5069)